ncbi:MAG: fibrillarin-like rRNA/tRNA 2'-O-methyltransferase [Methanobrevibacter arboriphilus]|uniref:Fibrillarin-like rRNA methylase n=3 Tax=Methanobrevibacter arboriphilus TaxID=39441 RepID=A0ACA8R556_METAZ|nr:fibrillarin-like rRNA/tRNA 2'-O-methyltransferase [Methanobrevibacter arboriphilus]MBF4468435.1 fibrillarin-like rRNA/tRNA 2'-O-methyltransferase [Methanobrevibacter arboriphilus]MCC7561524.1 fibrillarin-like rRNA/tRNA 2'-O-methyltransferase [Methanobrevibacter arboriphilus]BBL62476.1 fibrillarin-like rRNA methylase [Methanobrevibacter arboriphilus]GLI11618.1 fibrillarin-like rRNA methylase [Methanobrevibacter arboriphilus]
MNIYIKDDEIATENIVPGKRVYGEQLFEKDNLEYRFWNPTRSKLAAAYLNGLENLNIDEQSEILYLGASTGTTVSHISDIAKDGFIYALEFSPVSMRKLVRLCEKRPNIAPILGDATKPKKYLNLVSKVDLVYCDVAQPNQTDAFIDNMNLFLKKDGFGIIMIKSRSIDVNQKPQKIFKQEEKKLKEKGFKIVEKVKLEPYEKDHICFLVKNIF